MTRREIRETVFKILFSLEFNDVSEIREEAELELEHASLYDEDDNKMDAVAMTEEEKAYVIDRVEAVVAHITEIDETISGISHLKHHFQGAKCKKNARYWYKISQYLVKTS